MEMLEREIAGFNRRVAHQQVRSRAALSLQLLCGEDLSAVLAGGADEKRRVTRKLLHRLERERLRGLCGHWGYDLNRHIGLRQALDLIAGKSTKAA